MTTTAPNLAGLLAQLAHLLAEQGWGGTPAAQCEPMQGTGG